MIHNADIERRLHERLRQPASSSIMPWSLPVLFFGDLLMAKIATVNINPLHQEHLKKHNAEIDGLDRRFETLGSPQLIDRSTLTEDQCNRAISSMGGYFDPVRPAYTRWFAPITRLVQGLGYHYSASEVTHLDLVQEATVLPWSRMIDEQPEEAHALLGSDAPFVQWQLETFQLEVLICNGRSVLDHVIHLKRTETNVRERLVRLTWTIGVENVGSRQIADRWLEYPAHETDWSDGAWAARHERAPEDAAGRYRHSRGMNLNAGP